MNGLTSPFDGWTKQCFGWSTDYQGGRCAVSWLLESGGSVHTPYICKMAAYLAKKHDFSIDIWVKTGRSVLGVGKRDYPENVLVHANDVLRLTPDDFRTADLEFQFAQIGLEGVVE